MFRKYIVMLALVVSTALVYWQVGGHDFVNYDDQEYVTQNTHVLSGLTMEGIRWAFTSTHAANWHPLTWLSLMLDRQLFGALPAAPHLVNVCLHILNANLLFILLLSITGGFWQSAFVAAMFALHPLHVESVAWVAERKDTLSTLFFMVTIILYARYVERPRVSVYLAALFCFCLGLMAKPMLVTLPFVLLLLDYWPLKRFDNKTGRSFKSLLIEKLPFFLLAIFSSIVTIIVQRDAMPSMNLVPFDVRIGNALTAYVGYLVKMIWPVNLAVYYPLILKSDVWENISAALLLAVISALAVRSIRKRQYLLTGWLWYLGTLLPVIGVIQVGGQSMADRYTYIPLIGIFIMVAWGLTDLILRQPYRDKIAAVFASLLLLALSCLSWTQIGYWKDTYTLFSHCLAVTENNSVAMGIVGDAMVKQGRPAEASLLLQQALALNDKDPDLHYNMGMALAKLGRDAEAAGYISTAIRLKPEYARAQHDLGLLMTRVGNQKEAEVHLREASRIQPDDPDFHYDLGVTLVDEGKLDEAIVQYEAVLRQNPNHVKGQNNMGVALARQGKINESVKYFSRALELSPGNEEARRNFELCMRLLRQSSATANN